LGGVGSSWEQLGAVGRCGGSSCGCACVFFLLGEGAYAMIQEKPCNSKLAYQGAFARISTVSVRVSVVWQCFWQCFCEAT